MFCKNCGRQLLPNEKFCADCGTPVPEQEVSVQSEQTVEQPVAYNQPIEQQTEVNAQRMSRLSLLKISRLTHIIRLLQMIIPHRSIRLLMHRADIISIRTVSRAVMLMITTIRQFSRSMLSRCQRKSLRHRL